MSEAVKEIVVKASPATVFPYLVDPDLMVQWLGRSVALDPRPGGRVELNCGGNEGAGEFVDIVTNERVVFTFGWSEPGHPIPPGSTEVEISLTPQGEDTLVRLTHRGLPEDAVRDHEEGWAFYLERLAQVMRGETPMPDMN
ncbi:MAG TPA: SRPBCC family protein [Acidimicrobiales bacterium]|nr:SRPBCC family protein [Acidimicrobiales bacterium]